MDSIKDIKSPNGNILKEDILLNIIKECCADAESKLSPKLVGKVNRIIADCDLSHYSSLHKLHAADESTSTILGVIQQSATELTFDEQTELNQAVINKIQNKIPIFTSELEKLKNIATGSKSRKDQIRELQNGLDEKLNILREQENEKIELMMEWLDHRLHDVSNFNMNSSEILSLKTRILELKSKVISNALGIEWAPLYLPLERRLQTLAAAFWICLILCGEATCIFLFIQLLYSTYWWVGLLYGIWMLNDLEVCCRGGRRLEWVRNWTVWRYYCDYFPMKLVKTTDLDSTKNYLFACFPHGLVCSGAFSAFCTNALDFSKVFPGMTSNLITLGGHFRVPFFRDIILGIGACSSSLESLLYLLDRRKHQGKCVALIVGGAAEALDSHPGEYKVILKRRKGFIRVAMISGSPLVPVFSFGETDVFRPMNNPAESLLRKIQEKIRQITGISPMFPLGRGMFQYTFGVVPLRKPVTTVVGTPMEIEKNLNPSDEEVDAIHAKFTSKLVELFETEKSKYLKNYENTHLVIT